MTVKPDFLPTKRLAEICAFAYSDDMESDIEGFEVLRRFSNPYLDVQALGGVLNNDTLIVAFRGSSSRVDWFLNIFMSRSIIPYKKPGETSYEKTHQGFNASYGLVQAEIREFVQENKNFSHVVVTGHSLGGANALVCGLDLSYNLKNKWGRENDLVSIRTFSAPKVGNQVHRNNLERYVPNTIQYRMRFDLIPLVPILYRTAGTVEYVGNGLHVMKWFLKNLEEKF